MKRATALLLHVRFGGDGLAARDARFRLVAGERVVAGRDARSEIVLATPRVARRQFALTNVDGRLIAEDLNSSGGTFRVRSGASQGRLMRPTVVSAGDTLSPGVCTVELLSVEQESPTRLGALGPFQLEASIEPEHRSCSLRHEAFVATGPDGEAVVKRLELPFRLSDDLRAAWTSLMGRLRSAQQTPALAPVIGFGITDGKAAAPWYAMPVLDGEPLHRRISRHDRFSAAETKRALECVLLAIDAAAEVGVHFVPDPRHMMIHAGLPTCWDAGVTEWFEVGTKNSTLAGWTIRHANLTPERARAETPSGKGQAQAIALLAFAMLSGDWYWKCDRNPQGSMMNALMEVIGPVEPASARSTDLPSGFDEAFESCLSGAIESAGEAVEALALG